jgi:serine/threonine-protein kinase
VLRETPLLVPAHAVSIALQIARSLREAHTLGVVHRDLKPANVLIAVVDGDEHVKVLDFGLAKRLTVSLEDTNRNVVPGSPKYMAPEVIRQENVDGRADIYALGVLLYQMLIGRVPFDAENPLDILLAHVRQQPMPISQAAPNLRIPPQLEQLVMRCLEKQPAQRFANMQELIDALRSVAAITGVHGDMHVPMSMFPPSHTTSSGGTLSPSGRAGSPSGTPSNPAQHRKSEGPRLRLDLFDATPSHTKMKASALAKKSVLPIVIAVGCALIGALGVWLIVDPAKVEQRINATPLPAPDEPPPSAATGAQPAAPVPAPSAPAAQPAAPAEAPVMDFTDQLLEAAPSKPARPAPSSAASAPATSNAPVPSITVTARSIPTGAAVMVRGTRMGLTPVTFRFQDPSAIVGNTLTLTFHLAGHQNETVRHTITGPSALIDTVLESNEPAAEEEPTEEADPDQALHDLQERARELESPEGDPVLKITETPPSN